MNMMLPADSIVNASRWRYPIRVSFDLDDTLTSHCCKVPIEKGLFPAFIHNWLSEPLRYGTKKLFRELRNRDCSIWIYTTSGRSTAYIQRWFLLHGIRIDGVVNGTHHRALNQPHLKHMPSKFPPAFGIDLHVDDSEGVKMEGDEHGFRVLVIDPYDRHWTKKVLHAIARLRHS
jgi:hypothetical protein